MIPRAYFSRVLVPVEPNSHAAEYDDQARRTDEAVSLFPSLEWTPRHRAEVTA